MFAAILKSEDPYRVKKNWNDWNAKHKGQPHKVNGYSDAHLASYVKGLHKIGSGGTTYTVRQGKNHAEVLAHNSLNGKVPSVHSYIDKTTGNIHSPRVGAPDDAVGSWSSAIKEPSSLPVANLGEANHGLDTATEYGVNRGIETPYSPKGKVKDWFTPLPPLKVKVK